MRCQIYQRSLWILGLHTIVTMDENRFEDLDKPINTLIYGYNLDRRSFMFFMCHDETERQVSFPKQLPV